MKRKKELSNIEDKEVQFVKSILTQEDVKELFEYKDGDLYWKIDIYRGNANSIQIKVGSKAGSTSSFNYKRVQYKRKCYQISKLIFLMFYGYIPKYISYKDGNTLNTKIENLICVNKSQVHIRQKKSITNKTGYKGVFCERGKFKSLFVKNGKVLFLGYYNTPEEASKVYEETRIKYYGEFLKKCENG